MWCVCVCLCVWCVCVCGVCVCECVCVVCVCVSVCVCVQRARERKGELLGSVFSFIDIIYDNIESFSFTDPVALDPASF